MYFYRDGMTVEECEDCLKYILPMQHNINNPLNNDGSKDTFIEYWIASDERLTQDFIDYNTDKTNKLAVVDLRFLGVEAETWAKAFHHITKRENVARIFTTLCGATILEYIGAIRPVNIDYFGVGNSSIAFDMSIQLQYTESVKLGWKPLEYVSLAPGEVISGTVPQEV
jgi:hypothetical protein